MEHIAFELKMDPLDVRMKNLLQTGDTILFSGKIFEEENRVPGIVDEMKISADYEDWKKFITNFNIVSYYIAHSEM